MPDVGYEYKLDIGQAEAALDKIGAADQRLREGLTQTTQNANTGFTAAAQAAVEYSNRLAAATAEVRAAQAATRDVANEVRRLADANRDLEQSRRTAKSTDEYRRLTGEIAKNTAKIKEAKQAILENRQATEQERAAVQAVADARRQETNQTKLAAAAAKEAAAAAKQEASAAKEAATATKQTGESGGFLSGILGKVGGAFAAFFALNKLKQLGADIIDTTAEFERLEAVLTTIEGGNKDLAQSRFAQLRQYALTAPFEVKEITEAYTLLRNVGINPTIDQIKQLGDLAAASGKSFDAAANGLLGATTGRFVQLKQFGITAKQQGDQVALTFRGVTTVVEKSQSAISEYIFGLGKLNGVLGASDRIAETTGGKLSNLKDSFTELFNTIGEGNSGVINSFIGGLTKINNKVGEFLKSNDQKARDAAALPVDIFERVMTERFARVAEKAKKSGEGVTLAVGAFARDQTKLQENLLQQAEDALIVFNTKKAVAANVSRTFPFVPTNSQEANLVRSYGGNRGDQEEIQLKAVIAQRKAALGLIQQQQLATERANDIEGKGIIELLEAKIKQEKLDRGQATNRKEIHRLNVQILADEAELKRLLEQQDKAAAQRANKLAAALRALYQERATLQSLAAKAAIKESDDLSERARLSFTEALRQVDLLEQKLKDKEAAVRKAGGRGSNADGVIDGVQQEQLTVLRLAALDAYYTDLQRTTEAREQRLFDLRADTEAKEVEAVDRKYDKLIKANTDGLERAAIEDARQRELLALRQRQEQARIDRTAALATARASELGNTFGTDTGISVIEAKRAEKKALLEIEQKAAQDTLNNTLLLNTKEGELARAQAAARLSDIKVALAEVEREKKAHAPEDFVYKLVFGEQDSPQLRQALDEVAKSVASSYSQILQAEQQAAANRANTATQAINELGTQIQAQISLRESGAASNIKGLLEEQQKQKQIRKEALDDQRKAAQQQVIIDALSQASSITTAAANVFAAFSEIPYIGVALGIAAAGVLIGGFTAAKIKAYQVAGQIGSTSGSGFFKGGYTGGSDVREERGVVHGKEFVHTADVTEQYRGPLFEALHAGRPQDIDWSAPQMRALLPDMTLPGKLREEKAAHQIIVQQQGMGPVRAELAAVREELTHIKVSNAQMASEDKITPMPDGYQITKPNGSVKRVRFT